MKRFIIFAFVIIFAIKVIPLSAFAKDSCLDDVYSYILIETTTGSILDGKNFDIKMNCGYVSQLMSILLIAEDIETGKFLLSTELSASNSVINTKGAVIWLEPSDKMTVDELLKSVIIGNANDAMTVLAEASEHTIDDFVSRMNSEAFEMGLRDTAFYSPYGYYDEREYSTARNIAEICRALYGFDFLQPYFKTWREFVKEGATELVNENRLSKTYDWHIGFKACHSDEAKYCIAECGINETGTSYTSVILGATTAEISFEAAKKLLKKGYSDFKVTATMFPDEMLHPLNVREGEQSVVDICISNESRIVIPRGVSELCSVTVLPEFIRAPVKKGQIVGAVGFYSGKDLVCEADIVTNDKVEVLSYFYIFVKTMAKMLK